MDLMLDCRKKRLPMSKQFVLTLVKCVRDWEERHPGKNKDWSEITEMLEVSKSNAEALREKYKTWKRRERRCEKRNEKNSTVRSNGNKSTHQQELGEANDLQSPLCDFSGGNLADAILEMDMLFERTNEDGTNYFVKLIESIEKFPEKWTDKTHKKVNTCVKWTDMAKKVGNLNRRRTATARRSVTKLKQRNNVVKRTPAKRKNQTNRHELDESMPIENTPKCSADNRNNVGQVVSPPNGIQTGIEVDSLDESTAPKSTDQSNHRELTENMTYSDVPFVPSSGTVYDLEEVDPPPKVGAIRKEVNPENGREGIAIPSAISAMMLDRRISDNEWRVLLRVATNYNRTICFDDWKDWKLVLKMSKIKANRSSAEFRGPAKFKTIKCLQIEFFKNAASRVASLCKGFCEPPNLFLNVPNRFTMVTIFHSIQTPLYNVGSAVRRLEKENVLVKSSRWADMFVNELKANDAVYFCESEMAFTEKRAAMLRNVQ